MAIVTGNRVTLIRENGSWHTYDLDVSHKPLPSGVVMPSYGEVYTVRKMTQTHVGAGLMFSEIRNPEVLVNGLIMEIAFLAKFFRRVTNISVFKKLLAPSPELEKEVLFEEHLQQMDDEMRRMVEGR